MVSFRPLTEDEYPAYLDYLLMIMPGRSPQTTDSLNTILLPERGRKLPKCFLKA